MTKNQMHLQGVERVAFNRTRSNRRFSVAEGSFSETNQALALGFADSNVWRERSSAIPVHSNSEVLRTRVPRDVKEVVG